jgi:5-methylthioadenosine/S-adenosylhomocysteine deaminase
VQVETLIHARWVVPVDPDQSILENHSIAIDAGRIAAILPTSEAIEQIQAARTVNLPRHALIPGLVNAHTHAPMSLFRGLADDMPLMTWLNDHIWPAEAKWVHEEFIADGTRLAVAEMLRSGTTCFNDMYFFPDVTARVAQGAGIRSVVGLILIDFPSAWASDADDYLRKAVEVHDQFRNEPLVSTAFAPHAPYSVSDEPLARMLTLDNELEIPVHMHVHETADELQQSQQSHATRPIERLKQLGLLNPSLVAVHMTQLTDEEIDEVARSGAHVVHCPESNLKLASGFCPVQKLLDAGINVALGTDSAASNNDLDMLGEMKTAALLGKGVAQDASALPAHKVLEMATINGARALGLADKIGSLETGKEADIVSIDLGQLETQPLFNPVSQIVYAAGRGQVSDVWVAGRRLLANGQLSNMDMQAIATSTTRWHARITGKYLDGPPE